MCVSVVCVWYCSLKKYHASRPAVLKDHGPCYCAEKWW